MAEMKVGLVLSGGGAKGAYQVGVLKALKEFEIPIEGIAGASIGALNGAILASAPTLGEGIQRLEEIWRLLAATPPLQPNVPKYVRLLLDAGLHLKGVYYPQYVSRLLELAITKLIAKLPEHYAGLIAPVIKRIGDLKKLLNLDAQDGILKNDPLHKMLDAYLDLPALANGLPLYVSAFESAGDILDIINIVKAELGVGDTADSKFFHIQSLPQEEQRNALLASAALPLLFSPQELGGKQYTDGGQGGWQKSQGNTPIKPLIEAGHDFIIVTHLSDGSLWSRSDFPDVTILEIRPQASISRNHGLGGGAKDLLGFNPDDIESWMQQGYEDAIICVGRVRAALRSRSLLQTSESLLDDSSARIIDSEMKMQEAMMRITGRK
jgi:NTE family protein